MKDVNGDNKADLVLQFYETGNRRWQARLSNGTSFVGNNDWGNTTTPNMQVLGLADVNGDNQDDLIIQFYETGNRRWQARLSNGTSFVGNNDWANTTIANLQVVGLTDVNGDNKADLILQYNQNGTRRWQARLSNGSSFLSSNDWTTTNISNMQVVGLADVNGDNKNDLILQYDLNGTRRWQARLSNGTSFVSANDWTTTNISNMQVVGLADVNGDNKNDLILQYDLNGTRRWQARLSNGTSFVSANDWTTTNISNMQVVGLADVNGDNKNDLILQYDLNGTRRWQARLSNGTSFVSANDWTTATNPNAQVVGLTDVSGDNKADLVLQFNGGTNRRWQARLSNGTSFVFGNDWTTNNGTNVQVLRTIGDRTFISINDIRLTEGNNGTTSLAKFNVSLSNLHSQPVTVGYSTANGTATVASGDYAAIAGSLTFNPGETTKTITVNVNGDNLVETDETFAINLSNPSNATITDSQGIGTIVNEDIVSGNFNYGEALQKSFLFYEAQRSGVLPANNRIEWRGNSALGDGSDVGVNLTGGYYDAGDHVKFAFPMASSMTMLGWGVAQYGNAYANSGQLDEALSAIKWGTDWLIKAHITEQNQTKEFWGQVGKGDIDHNYWGSAEGMTMARPSYKIDAQHPGSDLASEAAAALAAASIIFRPTNVAYADLCLQNAKQLYQFADTYRGNYSNSITDAANYYNSGGSYGDELSWGAMWLYKATGDNNYLSKAENYYQNLVGGLGNWTQSWGDKQYGTAILLAQTTNKVQYRNDVENWLNYWTNDNGSGIAYTPGGMAWLTQWGSLRCSANTAFLAGVYSDSVNDYNDKYANFAQQQIDYILGDNPRNSSYMVGFGNNYPLRPHHAGSHGGTWNNFNSSTPNAHILYGGLVGGPKSANDYDYQDIRTDYVANEVALDYNAGLTGALARMYSEFGGNPLTDSQLDSLPGIVI